MQKRFDTRYIMDILETKFRCAIYGGLMLLKVRICMAVSRGSIFRSSLSLSTFHGSLPTFSEMHTVTYPSQHACTHARAYACLKLNARPGCLEGVKLQFAKITRSVRLFF